jgi:hypothetical protein
MNFISSKNKKGAMELSVGTIVTIVLLMTVLILGLVLVRTIFSGAIENIDSIDQAVKNEINKLFSEDTSRKVVIYPATRLVSIQKGNDKELGFAFSIRNVETQEGRFSYTVSVNDPNIRDNCGINAGEADAWIKAGGQGDVTLPPGNRMVDPEFVRFIIPEEAPPCLVRYGLDIKKDGQQYSPTVSIDIKVKSR